MSSLTRPARPWNPRLRGLRVLPSCFAVGLKQHTQSDRQVPVRSEPVSTGPAQGCDTPRANKAPSADASPLLRTMARVPRRKLRLGAMELGTSRGETCPRWSQQPLSGDRRQEPASSSARCPDDGPQLGGSAHPPKASSSPGSDSGQLYPDDATFPTCSLENGNNKDLPKQAQGRAWPPGLRDGARLPANRQKAPIPPLSGCRGSEPAPMSCNPEALYQRRWLRRREEGRGRCGFWY